MASNQKRKLLIKDYSPDDFGRALAADVAVRAGVKLNDVCRVRTDFRFTRGGARMFESARVEVEVV